MTRACFHLAMKSMRKTETENERNGERKKWRCLKHDLIMGHTCTLSILRLGRLLHLRVHNNVTPLRCSQPRSKILRFSSQRNEFYRKWKKRLMFQSKQCFSDGSSNQNSEFFETCLFIPRGSRRQYRSGKFSLEENKIRKKRWALRPNQMAKRAREFFVQTHYAFGDT